MNVLVQETGRAPRPNPTVTSTRAQPRHRNGVLAALSPLAFSVLEPHLRHREFKERSVLWHPGEQLSRVYFPWSGVIGIILPVGNGVEVASVGREGAAGIDYGSGQSTSVTQGVAQIAGTFSYMPALSFANAARKNAEIGRLAAICCNWLLTQSQQTAACNAVHPADARFCRWLLQCSERGDGNVIPSTQEAVGHALGIRRTTVTLIAQGLQIAGIISYRRGKIMVRDRDRLRSAACGCCAALGPRNWPAEQLVRNWGDRLDPHASTG